VPRSQRLRTLFVIALVFGLSSTAIIPYYADGVSGVMTPQQGTPPPLSDSSHILRYPISVTVSHPNSSLVYQQMLVIGNSSRNYSYYGVNPEASNILFSYSNGTGIYSWVQSMNASSIVIWMKINQCINQTIYMNVYPGQDNFFSGPFSRTGEAPQLSATYAGYDNGAEVFLYYANFVLGTAFSSYHIAIENRGNVTVDNGLIINGTANIRLRVENATAGGTGYACITYLQSGTTFDQGWMQSAYSKYSTFSSYYGTTGIRYFYDTNSSRPYFSPFQSGPKHINATMQYAFVAMIPNGVMPAYSIGPYTTVNLYAVAFSESGLPPGTHWSATLEGVSESSNSSAITFDVTNGSYGYSIGSVSGFLNTPSSSSISVNGANVSVYITFSRLYSVTFMETGLIPGTVWSVSLGNQTGSSNDSSIEFQVLKGTYQYDIQNVSGMSSSVVNGNLSVSGRNETVSVVFSRLVQFTFYVTGLPYGAKWSLLIDGSYYNSSVPFITINMTNKTYSYGITLPSNYKANRLAGNVDWSTGVVLIKVYRSSSYLIPMVAAIAVVAVVILSYQLVSRKKRSNQKINLN
jgi:hypothetical protein